MGIIIVADNAIFGGKFLVDSASGSGNVELLFGVGLGDSSVVKSVGLLNRVLGFIFFHDAKRNVKLRI